MVLADSAKRDTSFGIVVGVRIGEPHETTGERHTPHTIHASAEGKTSWVVFHLRPTHIFSNTLIKRVHFTTKKKKK